MAGIGRDSRSLDIHVPDSDKQCPGAAGFLTYIYDCLTAFCGDTTLLHRG